MSEPKKLEIMVTGDVNTGKTSVAYEIQAMLESWGIKCTVKDIDLDGMSNGSDWFEYQDDRMLALAKTGLKVNIVTKQVRSPK